MWFQHISYGDEIILTLTGPPNFGSSQKLSNKMFYVQLVMDNPGNITTVNKGTRSLQDKQDLQQSSFFPHQFQVGILY